MEMHMDLYEILIQYGLNRDSFVELKKRNENKETKDTVTKFIKELTNHVFLFTRLPLCISNMMTFVPLG